MVDPQLLWIPKEIAARDDLGRSGKKYIVILPAQVQRAGGSQHAHRAFHHPPRHRRPRPRRSTRCPNSCVSPAPRSKKRTSRVWRSITCTKETLVRFGKRGWRSSSAPSFRQSKSKSARKPRTADFRRSGSRRRARERWRSEAPRCAPRPCSSPTGIRGHAAPAASDA